MCVCVCVCSAQFFCIACARALTQVNVKLKDTLQKAGGATNIIVKLILLILLCAIGAYVYQMMA